MHAKQTLEKFEELAGLYERQLERYDMEQLTRSPEKNEWSLGQMYVHLIQSALHMHLRHIESCREPGQQASNETAGSKTEEGLAVFALGALPPIRIRVPASRAYTPSQPESKQQLTEGLQEVVRRMRQIEPELDSIPLSRTAAHPRLGALNAKEWFSLIEMHYRHHLRQKERLDVFLGAE
ncbi:DinB family protein [Paenibacillus hodogayensis]|uniref:DinB family protein n=1 Tax=Paenibacillus hodogayensis TaxID=279208 RepID=A0ABV5VRY9_9BACL